MTRWPPFLAGLAVGYVLAALWALRDRPGGSVAPTDDADGVQGADPRTVRPKPLAVDLHTYPSTGDRGHWTLTSPNTGYPLVDTSLTSVRPEWLDRVRIIAGRD